VPAGDGAGGQQCGHLAVGDGDGLAEQRAELVRQVGRVASLGAQQRLLSLELQLSYAFAGDGVAAADLGQALGSEASGEDLSGAVLEQSPAVQKPVVSTQAGGVGGVSGVGVRRVRVHSCDVQSSTWVSRRPQRWASR
jgi:hypothetical protein